MVSLEAEFLPLLGNLGFSLKVLQLHLTTLYEAHLHYWGKS